MQTGNSIVNLPLVGGIALSIALHVAALYSRGSYTPPEPLMESGRTVVQLTLQPSRASQAAAPEPIPPEPPQPEEAPPEPPVEQQAALPVPVEPIPVPSPEPVAEPTPEPVEKALPEPPKPNEPEPAPTSIEEIATVNSVEQDASLVADKGVMTGAETSSPITPSYPRISRRRGEEGIVTLSVQVLPSGKAGHIEVIGSSRFKRLDDAAIKAVKRAMFTPAMQAGHPIESITELSITFELNND